MSHAQVVATLSHLAQRTLGVFRGADAVEAGISRKQLTALLHAEVISRELPDTYRMTAVSRSEKQALWAAVL